jgi:pimeloyl-ACP methyl ester carboxylesterase
MLDLLITYFNFIILSIGYIVKKFAFFPPDPPHYKSIPTDNENEEDIAFLIKNKKKQKIYIGIEFRQLDYRFIKIIDKNNNSLPLLLFNPPSSLSVCIIYSHGNSGDLGSCLLEYYDIALHTNCLVVSFEYPGYGECKDQPLKESEFLKNLKLTYYFVRKILGFKSNQIILYGFSLGTGIMFDIACKKEYPAAGLILQSPFLSILRTLYNFNRTPYFDLFNNCDKAKHLKIKTLFIHGNNDQMVPYIHGRILSKLVPQQYFYDFLTVDKAGHNNIFKVDKDLIYKKIRKFIRDCTGKSLDSQKKQKIIQENQNLDEYGKNIKNIVNYNNKTNNDKNRLNKSDEIKRPSISFLKTNQTNKYDKNANISLNSSLNNELRILVNNHYNNKNYNGSYKNYYPSKVYYINNNHNNSKKNRKYIYNGSDLNQLEGNVHKNYMFNINNIKNFFRNPFKKSKLNESYYVNSTFNSLNNSK